MWERGTSAAIGRSVAIYHRDAERCRAMERLLAGFVRPGGLCFDIGAHLGDRSLAMSGLGARVVALEPQPALFRALRLLCRRRAGIGVLRMAVGSAIGDATLRINRANPTVTSLSDAFIAASVGAPGWQGQVWDRSAVVPVTTLDALIEAHGRPDFVKIDVEGHEAEVLAGLYAPVPALSFEVTSLSRRTGLDCVARLERLGRHAYALSLGERHVFEPPGWMPPEAIRARIARLDHARNSGDVYARLLD